MVSDEELIESYRDWLEKYIKSSAEHIQKQKSFITKDFLEELFQKEEESEDLLSLPPDFLEICIWSCRQLGNRPSYSIPTGKPIVTEGIIERLDEIRKESEEEFRKALREVLNIKKVPGEDFKEDFLSTLFGLLLKRARKIIFKKKTKNALWFEEPLVSAVEQNG